MLTRQKLGKLLSILLLGSIDLTAPPVMARPDTAECKRAIENAKARLKAIPNVVIDQVDWRNVNRPEDGAPIGRPIAVVIILDPPVRGHYRIERGVNRILASPQFMKNISQDIIDRCNSVSSVGFVSMAQPGCGIAFGLMGDGEVKEFVYVDEERTFKYGEIGCN